MLHKLMMAWAVAVLLAGCSSNEKKPVTNQEKSEVLRQLGVRYLTLGMPAVAIQKLDRALELDADNPQLHNAIGVAYQRLQKDKEARYHFEKSLSLAPDNVDTLNNYGLYLCERHENAQGMEYLRRAVDSPVNSTRWQALTNKGKCSLALGQKDQAELNFKKALLLQPSYMPALLAMAEIKYINAEYMSARAFLERFNSANNSALNAQALFLGVKIEQSLGDEDMAEQYKNKLFKHFPDSNQAEQLL